MASSSSSSSSSSSTDAPLGYIRNGPDIDPEEYITMKPVGVHGEVKFINSDEKTWLIVAADTFESRSMKNDIKRLKYAVQKRIGNVDGSWPYKFVDDEKSDVDLSNIDTSESALIVETTGLSEDEINSLFEDEKFFVIFNFKTIYEKLCNAIWIEERVVFPSMIMYHLPSDVSKTLDMKSELKDDLIPIEKRRQYLIEKYKPIWQNQIEREKEIKLMGTLAFDTAVKMLTDDDLLFKHVNAIFSLSLIEDNGKLKLNIIDDHVPYERKYLCKHVVIQRYEVANQHLDIKDIDMDSKMFKVRKHDSTNESHDNAWICGYDTYGNPFYIGGDKKVHLSTWASGCDQRSETVGIAKINVLKYFPSPPVTWIVNGWDKSTQRFAALSVSEMKRALDLVVKLKA